MFTSNKSDTRSVTYVLSERKIRYALSCAPNNVQEMAPKQSIHQARKARALRTPRKPPTREIAPRIAN